MASFSFDETLSLLKRSFIPTLIVEGKSDYIALREFEVENVHWGFTVFAVDGRDRVIQLIEAFNDGSNRPIAFLLDRDHYVVSGIPENLRKPNILFTTAYSIENDLLIDGRVDTLMSPTERQGFAKLIKEFIPFFKCAMHDHLNGCPSIPLSEHPNSILDDKNNLREGVRQFVTGHPGQSNPNLSRIDQDPLNCLKGKSLLALVLKVLSTSKRKAKYSAASLLEIGAARRGERLKSIEGRTLDVFLKFGLDVESLN